MPYMLMASTLRQGGLSRLYDKEYDKNDKEDQPSIYKIYYMVSNIELQG